VGGVYPTHLLVGGGVFWRSNLNGRLFAKKKKERAKKIAKK
jgi:hypothetical protein